MKRTIKYVGLDVHQAITVASTGERSSRVIARTIPPKENTAPGGSFQAMRGAVNVAFEKGTQARWLHDPPAPLTHSAAARNLRAEPHRPGNRASRTMATLARGRAPEQIDLLHEQFGP